MTIATTMLKHFGRLMMITLALSLLSGLAGCAETPPKQAVSTPKAPAVKPAAAEKVAPQSQTAQASAKPAKVVAPAVNANPSRGQAGVLKAENPVLDFGRIEPGQKCNGEYVLKNVGTKVLEIDRQIGKSCGCTVPKLGKYILEPGETTTMKVTYSAGTHPGKVSKKVWLTTKSPSEPEKLTMNIIAEIRKHIENSPEKWSFQLRDVSDNKIPLTLESLDGSPFKVTGFNSTNNVVKLDFDAKMSEIKQVLPIEVDFEKLRNTPRGTLNVTVDHPRAKNVTVPFQVVMPFEAQPSRLFFRSLTPGSSQSRSIKIISNYDQSFEIASVTSQFGLIEVGSPVQSRDGYRLDVNIVVKDPKQTVVKDYLIVEIKDHPEETLKIYCYGRVEKAK